MHDDRTVDLEAGKFPHAVAEPDYITCVLIKKKQQKTNKLLNQPEHHGNNKSLYLSLKANKQILNW